MYRWLLRLLPRHRRLAFGDEMERTFAASVAYATSTGGRFGLVRAWCREVAGLVRFAARERLMAFRPTGGPVADEVRWAWRGVRGRGWRAPFSIGLLGVVVAANVVVFAAADAFVFRAVPFPSADELVVFTKRTRLTGATASTNRDQILEWRKHTDLFSGIQAHESGSSWYLRFDGVTEIIPTHRVTPGMFELLGVLPIHGRPFVTRDAEPGAPATIVVGDAIARRLFGDPVLALGRTLEDAPDKPTIVGVMAPSFRFPTAVEQIWRPMKLELTPDNFGVGAVARLQAGWSIAAASRAYLDRLPAVSEALPNGFPQLILKSEIKAGALSLQGYASHQRREGTTRIFVVLLGAAGCLLLIACANVVSLELAGASARQRTIAVCSALGAGRASLIRVLLLEGALLLGASLALAVLLAWWGLDTLTSQLTTTMRDALVNPLDLDPRSVGFMGVVAACTWALTTVPVIVQVSRTSVLDGLRHDPRTTPVSRRAARARQILMTAQVALTVMLLVGGLLFVRAYMHRVGLDKGFDADGLLTLTVSQAPDAAIAPVDLSDKILTRLRTLPGVLGVSQAGLLPPSTQAGASGPMNIRGREEGPKEPATWPMVSLNNVDPEYFRTMSIVAVEGRLFDDSTNQDQIVIDEKFARRYWPGESAVGARFNLGGSGQGGVKEFEVLGVSRSLRADRVVTDSGAEVYFGFIRLSSDYRPQSFVIRVDDEERLPMIVETIRSIGSRLVVRVDTVEARYRRLEADNRLAAAITSGFGTLAWVVAAAGIYAVMAFLVAGRTREIGIRLALGAERATVLRMVMWSSLKFVSVGVLTGLGAAALASAWFQERLFGVSPTDPLTYGTVALLVVVTAMAATLLPARRAARVDPAITLRSE
jgi:putative ABC transport system permease protein